MDCECKKRLTVAMGDTFTASTVHGYRGTRPSLGAQVDQVASYMYGCYVPVLLVTGGGPLVTGGGPLATGGLFGCFCLP